MQFRLVTMLGTKVSEDVYSVTLPTVTGEISVFPSHEQLVTIATSGIITVRFNKEDDDSKLEYYAISGGVIEINQRGLKVLVDEADHSDDIIEAESKAALERALKMQDEATDQVELEKAHQLVDRHMVRLKVAAYLLNELFCVDFINPSELVREEDTRLIISVLNYIAILYKLSIILRASSVDLHCMSNSRASFAPSKPFM